MTMIFCDSFDHYTSLTQKWDIGAANASISATAARTGIQGLLFNNSVSFVVRSLVQSTTFFIGMAVNLQGGPRSSNGILISLQDGGTAQISLILSTANTFFFTRGGVGGTVIGATSAAISSNVWHYIEIKVTIDPTVGVAELHVDGIAFLTGSGLNTRNTTNSFAQAMQLGNQSSGFSNPVVIWIDDLYVNNSSGAVNNSYLGNSVISCKLPTGNGTTNQWAIGGSSPAATNWQSVNDNPPDDAVTFVSDSTVGHIDRYTFPAVTGANVSAVVVNLRAGTDVAGTRSIRAAVKSGATTADNGADFALSTSFADFQGIFETDPNTAAAWTVANVNAAEFGEKVTV